MATERVGAARHWDYCSREVVPFASMVSLQCLAVGVNTVYKLAANDGMSRHVFVVYAYAFATVILLPSPFISRQLRTLPSLNFSILLKIFVLEIVGYMAVILGFTGISYGSPTQASAINNLSPTITFVLAIIFRSLLHII